MGARSPTSPPRRQSAAVRPHGAPNAARGTRGAIRTPSAELRLPPPPPAARHPPPHEVLQHGALPRALPAHHGDLRQVQVAALPDGAEGVLQLVDQRDQLLHAAVPHGGGGSSLRPRRRRRRPNFPSAEPHPAPGRRSGCPAPPRSYRGAIGRLRRHSAQTVVAIGPARRRSYRRVGRSRRSLSLPCYWSISTSLTANGQWEAALRCQLRRDAAAPIPSSDVPSVGPLVDTSAAPHSEPIAAGALHPPLSSRSLFHWTKCPPLCSSPSPDGGREDREY